MSGSKGLRTTLTAGFAIAVAGSGLAMAPGAHAAAQYKNGGVGWVDHSVWHEANPDGSGEHTVTLSGAGVPANALVYGVAYSRDGKQVAVTIVGPGVMQLWVADADGTNARLVTTTDNASGHIVETVWAPDAKSIYYSGYRSGFIEEVMQVKLDGSAPVAVPGQDPTVNNSSPTVSPSGQVAWLAQGRTEVIGHLRVLDPGSTTPRVLPVDASSIAYSPDGSRIAVYRAGPSPTGGGLAGTLSVMNDDGTNAFEVYHSAPVQNGGLGGQMAWSPDGKDIAFWGPTITNGPTPELMWRQAVPDRGAQASGTVTSTVAGNGVSWQAGASNLPTRPILDRIGGTDRIATAVDASQYSFDAAWTGGRQANVAVISRDDNYADALAGNALAAQKHGPLLLTGTSALDGKVKAELQRILAPGSTVYILGGDQALSPAVEQAVKNAGFTPKRLQGADRFATSVAIAKEIAPNGPHSALVATGANYPDALTAGAAAAQDLAGGVVLLSQDGQLPDVTKAYLAGIDPHKVNVYGVGGQGVAALKAAFPAWDGLTVPLAGADRYATAYQVAHSKLFGLDAPVTTAGIATGATWPDALSGGALIAAQHGPLLLAGPAGLPAAEATILTTNHLTGLAVFGGTAAVPDAIATTAANTAFGVGTWSPASNRQAPPLP
jgi:hypothetical protein